MMQSSVMVTPVLSSRSVVALTLCAVFLMSPLVGGASYGRAVEYAQTVSGSVSVPVIGAIQAMGSSGAKTNVFIATLVTFVTVLAITPVVYNFTGESKETGEWAATGMPNTFMTLIETLYPVGILVLGLGMFVTGKGASRAGGFRRGRRR